MEKNKKESPLHQKKAMQGKEGTTRRRRTKDKGHKTGSRDVVEMIKKQTSLLKRKKVGMNTEPYTIMLIFNTYNMVLALMLN